MLNKSLAPRSTSPPMHQQRRQHSESNKASKEIDSAADLFALVVFTEVE
jgi:hypothetical protein